MFAITNDGEVYGWGRKWFRTTRISNTEDQKLPVKTTLTNIKTNFNKLLPYNSTNRRWKKHM